MAAQITIKLRRDTAARWTSVNPTLAAGEMGVETDTNKIKVGDGTTAWSGLSYITNADTLATITARGATTSTTLTTTNTTDASSTSTGSIITSGGIGVAKNAYIGGDIVVTGNMTVNGTTSTINSTTLSVNDKNIELGKVATPTDTTADGGGLTLHGTTDKTWNWVNSTAAWTSSENIDIASGKVIKFAGTQALSATQYTGNAATVTNGVYTNGTYSNPSWITGLAWSKISSTPTTLSGYGITDAMPATQSLVAYASGTAIAISDSSSSYVNNLVNITSTTGAITVTVNDSTFAVGTQISFLRNTTQTVTFASGTATVYATPGLKIRAQYSLVTLIKVTDGSGSGDVWVLTGDLSA